MSMTYTMRPDGRMAELRLSDGTLFWSFDGGWNPAVQAKVAQRLTSRQPAPHFRCDAADEQGTEHMQQITSSAQAKAARHAASQVRQDAAPVRSSAELMDRLGLGRRRSAQASPPAPAVRFDAPASGPVRSSAEYFARYGGGPRRR